MNSLLIRKVEFLATKKKCLEINLNFLLSAFELPKSSSHVKSLVVYTLRQVKTTGHLCKNTLFVNTEDTKNTKILSELN